ncbi:hypothetical protein LSPH24S_02156 [Lysinibacillus sphaericus]
MCKRYYLQMMITGKWFILHFLVIKLPVESQVQFKQYLIRVAQTPTQNEIAEELDEIAKEIVDML